MRHPLASLALLCLHVAVAGCALVPIPLPLELTGPVNGIRVLDAQTKQVVPEAKVTFSTEPSSMNWLLGQPTVVLSSGLPPADGDAFHRDADGTFVIESRYRFVTCRPWGIGPLGVCLYEGPRAVFNVWAPGYHSPDGDWVIAPRRRANFPDSQKGDTSNRQGELDEQGILHVYLERAWPHDGIPRPP